MSIEKTARGWAMWAATVALGVVVAGCAADAGGVAPVSTEGTEGQVQEQSLTQVVTGIVSATGQVVGVCAPLTCCLPTGAEWGTDPLQTGLKALGCSTPAAYTERYGSTNWWMFTKCQQTPALSALVAKYANVAPYNSGYAINECLLLNNLKGLVSGDVFVQFDPTCTSCHNAVAK